jgi:5-methylcytosine-specific restriction protein A
MPISPAEHRPFTHKASKHTKINPKKAHIQGTSLAERGSSTQRGYNSKWRKARDIYAKANPLCVMCAKRGLITEMKEVDHKIPHRGDESLFWDQENWQSLCKECHSTKTAAEDGGFGNLRAQILPKWMPKPTKRLIVVCGPPRSGKTTYVNNNAKPEDMRIDVDVIREEMVGAVEDEWNALSIDDFLRERNRRLALFCRGNTKHPQCWLIATAGTQLQRTFWQELGAAVVIMDTAKDTCLQRIARDDKAGPEEKEKKKQAVLKWH